MTDTSSSQIRRLTPADAPAVVACFRRAYGNSYANALFYDAAALGAAMDRGQIRSVGAFRPAADAAEPALLGHMAMHLANPDARYIELGNTVVDAAARGEGLAWQIGAQLSLWCRELGYTGFLHYPTTDHHIMQRQSVRSGYETGLMLSYIPADTDAGFNQSALRGAATIVFEPYMNEQPELAAYLPERFASLCRSFATDCGISRVWHSGTGTRHATSVLATSRNERRGLERLSVQRCGQDYERALYQLRDSDLPCRQLDLDMSSPDIEAATERAVAAGFRFCGWLPGYPAGDTLRLQHVDETVTDMTPNVVNPVAQAILAGI